MTKIPALIASSLLAVVSATAANKELLGTAKTIVNLYDVEWNKERQFDSEAELKRMRTAISDSPLYTYFRSRRNLYLRSVQKGSDIILKFHENRVFLESETISLTVYDPDDNGVIYSEMRPLIDVDNDIDRLVSHFLSVVDSARAPYRRAE